MAVNANAKERWQVAVAGEARDLSPYGWAAAAEGFVEYCTELDGRRIGYVDSPAYRFADGGGRWHDFGPLATDGAVALLFEAPGRLRLIPLAEATAVSLTLPASARLEPVDAAGTPITTPAVQPQRDGERVKLPVAGVEAWLIETP